MKIRGAKNFYGRFGCFGTATVVRKLEERYKKHILKASGSLQQPASLVQVPVPVVVTPFPFPEYGRKAIVAFI